MSTRFIFPYPPGDNHLYAVFRGRKILSQEGRAFKQRMKWLCLKQGAKPISGPVVVSISVYRPRKAGDLTRSFKALLDAVKGFLFDDDGDIVELHARRYEDKEDPRVEVTVEATS